MIVRQQFTQKERDVETGLDYFEARYYSSTQGRFISPDEFTSGPDELYTFADEASNNPTFYADLANPQSLNKYQYAYSNPLRYLDPDGHDPQNPCGCKTYTDQEIVESVTLALDWVADKTGITTAADWIRRGVPAIAKYALDHGGKSAAQQDMDDLSGRAAKPQNQAQSEGGHGSSETPSEPQGGYTNVPDPKNAGPRKKFTPRQKKEILEANRAKNGGELRSDLSGQRLNPGTRTQKGQRRDPNEAQVDHNRARSRGGTNRSRNARVLSGQENRKKGTKDP